MKQSEMIYAAIMWMDIKQGLVLGLYTHGPKAQEAAGTKGKWAGLQWINLPVSDFCIPTYEMVDENTVAVCVQQTPAEEDRVREEGEGNGKVERVGGDREVEGGDPLMNQAGTPEVWEELGG